MTGTIDRKQYRLLVRLFRTLSGRQELLPQSLGDQPQAAWLVTFLFAAMGTLMGLALLNLQAPPQFYVMMMAGLTGFALGVLLLGETANTLVNPVEALVLAQQPINGATYTAAKLTHLGRLVAQVAGVMNMVPALLALLLPGASPWLPLQVLGAGLAAGAAAALGWCAVFGWLLRFIPHRRMKAVAQVAMAVVPASFQVLHLIPRPKAMPVPETEHWVALGGVLAVAAAAGLRALAADYLASAPRLVQGGSGRRNASAGRAGLGRLVARLGGGPAAQAGFTMTGAMMRRDWQFGRVVAPNLPGVLLLMASLLRDARDPFGGGLTGLLAIPHLLGMLAITVSSGLAMGSHPEAGWLFRLAPAGAFAPFARGVLARLWLLLAGVPNALLTAAGLWFWPAADALVFGFFSLAVTSLYVTMAFGLVERVPFTGVLPPDHSWEMMPLLLAALIAAAAAVWLSTLLFVSHGAVLLAAVAVLLAAVFSGRLQVRSAAIAMRVG